LRLKLFVRIPKAENTPLSRLVGSASPPAPHSHPHRSGIQGRLEGGGQTPGGGDGKGGIETWHRIAERRAIGEQGVKTSRYTWEFSSLEGLKSMHSEDCAHGVEMMVWRTRRAPSRRTMRAANQASAPVPRCSASGSKVSNGS